MCRRRSRYKKISGNNLPLIALYQTCLFQNRIADRAEANGKANSTADQRTNKECQQHQAAAKDANNGLETTYHWDFLSQIDG